MKISIVGIGYVGLVTGACLAELGHEITFVDIDEEKVMAVNEFNPPLYEKGLKSLISRNRERIKATAEYDAIATTDATFICVGTPSLDDESIDLSQIKGAVKEIGNCLKKKDGWHTIIVKSTVIPGTTEKLIIPILEKESKKKNGKDFGVAVNPEFLREGKGIEDTMNPDRIVIGSIDEPTAAIVEKIYEKINAPIIKTDPTTAEMIKYASNALLATKISFANEIGNLCKVIGVDVYEVMRAVGMDRRISPHFLDAGAGFGGSCFPKDVKALATMMKSKELRPRILDAVMRVNEGQPMKMIRLLEKHCGKLGGKRIAVLGLAFKPDTDDVRESRSIPVIKELMKRNAKIVAYDPLAMEKMKTKEKFDIEYAESAREALKGADGCLLMTKWKEFANLDFREMNHPIVIDGRRIAKPSKDIVYEGICW